MTEKPSGYYTKKDKHGRSKVHPVFESQGGAPRREPRAKVYRVQEQRMFPQSNKCPECRGEIVDGKCKDCGWTPEFARTWKKLEQLEKEDGVKGFTVKFKYNNGKKEEVHLIARDYEEALEGSLWKVSNEKGVKHDGKDVEEITIVDPDLGEILHKIGSGARTVARGAYGAGRTFVRGLPRVSYAAGRVAGTPEAMRESYREGKEAGLPGDGQRARGVARAYNIGVKETRWDKAEVMRLIDQTKSSDVAVRATAAGYLKRYYPEVFSELTRPTVRHNPTTQRYLGTSRKPEQTGMMEGYGYY